MTVTVKGGVGNSATVFARVVDSTGSWTPGPLADGPSVFHGNTYQQDGVKDISWYVAVQLTDGQTVTSDFRTNRRLC